MCRNPPSGIMDVAESLEKDASRQGGELTSMPVEENMALARRFMEAKIKGDLDAVDGMLAPDYVSHTKILPDQEPGPEGEKRAIAQISAAFSNSDLRIEDQVDRKSTRLNSSHANISYAVFCLKKKKRIQNK